MKSNKKNFLVTGYSSKIFESLFNNYFDKESINFYFLGRTSPNYNYVKWVKIDFADTESIESSLVNANLPNNFDYVFLNHGILFGEKIGNYKYSQIINTISINYTSYLIIVNYILNRILNNSSIVLTSSISAKNGSYDDIYASTKMGLEGFVNSISKKLSKSRINCISPGIISDANMTINRTDIKNIEKKINLTPLKKLTTSQEVAAGVNFLLSNESSHITGQILNLHGGL